jgi:hypothetical protein
VGGACVVGGTRAAGGPVHVSAHAQLPAAPTPLLSQSYALPGSLHRIGQLPTTEDREEPRGEPLLSPGMTTLLSWKSGAFLLCDPEGAAVSILSLLDRPPGRARQTRLQVGSSEANCDVLKWILTSCV